MPSSVRAHTIATSATDPLVIQVFSPFKIQPIAVLLRARQHARGIRSEPRLREPEAANRLARLQLRKPVLLLFGRSVGEDADTSPARLAPKRSCGFRSRARSSSCITRPYSTLLMPAQP